ncbi:hypothetical protein RI367_005654 [Sorochytrium milnesiophthora]
MDAGPMSDEGDIHREVDHVPVQDRVSESKCRRIHHNRVSRESGQKGGRWSTEDSSRLHEHVPNTLQLSHHTSRANRKSLQSSNPAGSNHCNHPEAEPLPPPASTTSPSPPIVSPLSSVSSFASPSSPPEPTLLDAPTIANITSTETPARLHLAADTLVSNPASAIPTPEGMVQLLHELATLRAQVNAQQPSISTSTMQQSATNRPSSPSRYDLPEARPRPRPRIPTPDPFSGDSGQDLETFLASLEIFFTNNDLEYSDDTSQGLYLSLLLRGSALTWLVAARRTDPDIASSYTNLVSGLRIAFGLSDPTSDANRAALETSQIRASLREFYLEWNRLTAASD